MKFLSLFALMWSGACAADMPDFRPLVAEALLHGSKRIVIAPGTYRMATRDGQKCVWTLRDAHDVEIIAEGVTLISTQLTRALAMDHCHHLILRGLTVDYDPLPFTQGRITAVAEDKNWVEVSLHAGYPRHAYSRIEVVDPATRFRKRGMPFLWNTVAEMRGENVVRITLKNIGASALIGDLAVLSTGPSSDGIPHAVTLDQCAEIVLDHVTVHSAPGMGILECDGDGGSKYSGCRIIPGPMPTGANEERLLSTSWDAIQSKALRKGPLVENCEIRAAGDDSWSVQSSDYLVVAQNGSSAILAYRDPFCDGPHVGDHLARSLDSTQCVIISRQSAELHPPFVTPEIESKIKTAAPWTEWSVGHKAIEITVAGDFPFHVGDSVYCSDRQCNGFIFRNNQIRSAGRILVKASDGLLENNTINDGHAGITICPEVTGNGAFGIRNISIRNNHFSGTGYYCPAWWSSQAGCISITASGPGKTFRPTAAFRNIMLENNLFEDINGPSIVVSSTDGLRIANNTFRRVMTQMPNDTGGSYAIHNQSLIWLDACANVRASRNHLYDSGKFLQFMATGKDLKSDVLESVQASFNDSPTAP